VLSDSGADADSVWALSNANLDAKVSDVKAKTDLLPADPASESAVEAAIDTVPTANENADALLKRDWTAVSGAPASRSLWNALRKLMNRWALSGTTLTVYKEDDSTAAYTQTVTAAPGADPISEIDTD